MSQHTINSAQDTAAYIDETQNRAAVKALNEAGRRIQAFSKLDKDPKAQQAYWVAMKVITEVRDSERQR